MVADHHRNAAYHQVSTGVGGGGLPPGVILLCLPCSSLVIQLNVTQCRPAMGFKRLDQLAVTVKTRRCGESVLHTHYLPRH